MTPSSGAWILYDGECPFCSRFAQKIRLQKTVGPVRLIDARHPGPERDAVAATGFDINKGMALQYQGKIYHGRACVNRLALLSTRSGVFNGFAAWMFESKGRAAIIYPVLTTLRAVTLWAMGRKGIGGPAPP